MCALSGSSLSVRLGTGPDHSEEAGVLGLAWAGTSPGLSRPHAQGVGCRPSLGSHSDDS